MRMETVQASGTAIGAVTVRRARPTDERAWDEFVLRQDDAPPMALYRLGGILNTVCGADVRLSVAEDPSGTICGVLMAYAVSPFRGRRSLFSSYAGLLSTASDAATMLAKDAREWASSHGAGRAIISSGTRSHEIPVRQFDRPTLIFTIADEREENWKNLRDKTRNSIRKGRKSGLELVSGPDHLAAFYTAYSERMTAKSVPHLPFRFFEELSHRYAQRCGVFVARHGDRAVGGAMALYGEKTGLYLASGIRDGSEKLCVAHFLMWEMIEACRCRGIRSLDMGESRPGSGVYRFKEMFGGRPRPLRYYDLLMPPGGTENPVTGESGAVVPTLSLAGKADRAVVENLPRALKRRLLVWRKKGRRIV